MRTAALMAVLMAAGCSTQTAHQSASAAAPVSSAPTAGRTMAKLDGTDWRFVEVAGTQVPTPVTATLRVRGDRVSGRAGCNNFGARYQVGADGHGSFSQVISTKMACLEPPGAMQVEHQIFEVLPRVARMELRDGELALLDSGGAALARLEPVGGS